MLNERRRRSDARTPTVQGALQLGLVIMPEPGRLADALASLTLSPLVKVGPTQGHRIPATATSSVGRDEALLRELMALDGVLHVDVAFAHVIEDETP